MIIIRFIHNTLQLSISSNLFIILIYIFTMITKLIQSVSRNFSIHAIEAPKRFA